MATMLPITVTFEEEERQAVILALAHLSIERPGWDDMLNRIALKMDNRVPPETGVPPRAEMYEQFRELKRVTEALRKPDVEGAKQTALSEFEDVLEMLVPALDAERMMALICRAGGVLLERFNAEMLRVGNDGGKEPPKKPMRVWLAASPGGREILSHCYDLAKKHMGFDKTVNFRMTNDGHVHIQTTELEDGQTPGPPHQG